MGRIDRSAGQDATMERHLIRSMLANIEEYELVKSRNHPKYSCAAEFYAARGLYRQNFLKYYRRYLAANRVAEALIPRKSGRKFRDTLGYSEELLSKVKELRAKGYNRFDISLIVGQKCNICISPSSIYRLMAKLGLNRLNPRIKPEIRRICKMNAGELGHIDVHFVANGTVKELGKSRLYVLGLIDSYSRVCWLEPLQSIKSFDVAFATMDILTIMKSRYGVQFKEILSDNGAEFSSKSNVDNHPFERMLKHFEIKHRYTKPCRPQTNGKIERFWKTLENEVLEGEVFETLDEFRNYLMAYCIYYNEERAHQAINLKTPAEMTSSEL